MLKYIEKLQKEPEHVRRTALYIIMSASMAIVVSVWLGTLSLRLGAAPDTGENEGDAESTTSPFIVMKENAALLFQGIGEGVKEVKSVINEAKNATTTDAQPTIYNSQPMTGTTTIGITAENSNQQ